MLREHFGSKTTILEYIEETFESFLDFSFNEIDALIFSQMSYLNVERLVPTLERSGEAVAISQLYKAEEFENMVHKTLEPSQNIALIRAVCASPRFRNVTMNFFVNKYDKVTEEQFSAVTFQLATGQTVIAFRGTDLTVTGWKEDFNMFFISPVPSQLSAVTYLEEVAKKIQGDMILVGHSKGGNLAVYSSVFSEKALHKRVLSVYNLDGPGFPTDILEHNDYINEGKNIIKIVPEGSLIGIMFENNQSPVIIKSYQIGFLQHDPFSWKCDTSSFAESTQFTRNIKHLDKTFHKWIYELDVEQRKTLVDTLFTLISSMDAESIDEFSKKMLVNHESIKKALSEVDSETAHCIKEMLMRLVKISVESRFERDEEDSGSTFLSKLLPF